MSNRALVKLMLAQKTSGHTAVKALRAGIGVASLLGALSACSGADGDAGSSMLANTPEDGERGPSVTLASGGVVNYNRPAGMPIGRGAPSDEAPLPSDPAGVEPASTDVGELAIPDFEAPENDAPPCSGCVELNADVNDINQRDDFVFSAGGVNVTRVVWRIIVPFNSDQLFVQPFVDSSYGTYTDLDANAFPVDTPVELVHTYSGTANMVGLAIGSAGAWTGNMTMSVFVDSVTLEGADPAASPTFDAGLEGLATRSNTRNPRVVFHP